MSPFSGFLAQGGSRLLSLTNVYSNNKMPEAKNLSTAWASVGDSLQTVWIIGIRRIKNLKSRLHVLKYSLEYLDFQKCRLTLGHHHHCFTSCKSHSCFFFFPLANRTCSGAEFTCVNNQPPQRKCIPHDWVCDGDADCADALDEHQNCTRRSCGINEFTCSNGLCIRSSYRLEQLSHSQYPKLNEIILSGSLSSSFAAYLWNLGAIDATTVGTAVMSRAAPTRHASSTSSPARTAAAYPTTLSVMATMTVVMSPMSWSTCAAHQHPPALLGSSDVTMDTVSL